jgi:hypothetical protein
VVGLRRRLGQVIGSDRPCTQSSVTVCRPLLRSYTLVATHNAETVDIRIHRVCAEASEMMVDVVKEIICPEQKRMT